MLIHGAYVRFIQILLESMLPIKVNFTIHSGINDNAQMENARNQKTIHLDHHLD